MNGTDRRDQRPRFERIVLRIGTLLLRMTVIIGAWQFQYPGRSWPRLMAALGLSAIRLMASALGAAKRIVSDSAVLAVDLAAKGQTLDLIEPLTAGN